MTPKVSIIVPVYNAEKSIGRCVDSILNQEYKDFELLLMDDGSKDSSGTICDEYAAKDARVRVIHKANSGVSDTRNQAMDMARGVYLQFLDADDWITPNATRLFVEAAEQYQCDMVIADFYRVVGERVSHKGAIEEEGVLTREEFATQMMENPADFYYGVLWNKLFRREIVEKYRLRMDSAISWCEDFMFNLEYIRHCERFYALQVPIYYYVKTKGSLVSQGMNISKTIKMKLMVFEYYNDFYKQILTEEDYEKNRIQVYKFLVDAAGDGFVTPAILPWAKKLGEERMSTSQDAVESDGILMEEYRNRKLLDYYMEPIAIKNELSIEEIRTIFCLAQEQVFENRKELADFVGMGVRSMTIVLQKLFQKKIVQVTKKRGYDLLQIKFLQESVSILEELNMVQEKYDQARFAGFTEEEISTYCKMTERILQNLDELNRKICSKKDTK